MRKYTLLVWKKQVIAMLALLLSGTYGYCNTYTAVASGNWSSSATWGLGAPSFNITSDQIIIPLGIAVTLDNSLSVNGLLASVNVLGSLTSADTSSLYLNAGAITGTGTIQVGLLTLDSASLLAFAGPITVKNFSTASTGLELADSIGVNSTATIAAGTLTLITGGTLALNAGATLNMAGGAIAVNGGILNLSLAYNLIYSGFSATAGAEASSAFLNNVTIDVSDSSVVTLSHDLQVQGTLNLEQGYLSLNSHNLNIVGNVMAEGNGSIMSTSASNITFSSVTPPAGALVFATNANTVNNLQVNVGGFSATVKIGSNLNIDGSLQFLQGSLDIGNNTLSLASADSISGQGPDSYIITGDSGALSLSLTAGQGFVKYPIGTSAHYNPAEIQLNSGSASGNVMVGATNGVDSAGTSGTDLSLTQPMVDATWMIHSDINSNLSLNMKLAWSQSMEMNHFNRDSCYISHYTSAHWDTSAYTSSALYFNAQYSLERDSITSLSPFAIFGAGNSTTAINPVKDNLQFEIYPNPASDNIIIGGNNTGGRVNMEIINMEGQVVATYVLTDLTSNISLANIESGDYLVKLYNDQSAAVKWLVKF